MKKLKKFWKIARKPMYFIGFLMMLIGLNMVFKPLSVLGDVIPFIGDLIGMGTSVVSFLIALPCWLICIAIAWIFYRPVLGIILLILAVAAAVFFIIRGMVRDRKAGRSSCGGNCAACGGACAGCAMAGACHAGTKKNHP